MKLESNHPEHELASSTKRVTLQLGPATHTGFLIQSTFDTKGNFEMVVPQAAGGLTHYWRYNDPIDPPALPWDAWNGPTFLPTDDTIYDTVSLIQSNFSASGNGPGNLEVVAGVGSGMYFYFYWREDAPPWTWHGLYLIQDGVPTNDVRIEGNFGPIIVNCDTGDGLPVSRPFSVSSTTVAILSQTWSVNPGFNSVGILSPADANPQTIDFVDPPGPSNSWIITATVNTAESGILTISKRIAYIERG